MVNSWDKRSLVSLLQAYLLIISIFLKGEVNPPSAKIDISRNQYNDYIFRFLTKRAFIQVPTCL